MTAIPGVPPIVLQSNQPPARFYRGGARIARFRGMTSTGDRVPEDWIASTTSVRGGDGVGQTVLPDGRLLADAISADPIWWLGPDHVAEFGADSKLLLKLLDAGERLPVHAHPSGDFARAHLGTAHGKAEAWYILSPGEVYLALNTDLEAAQLRELVARQDAGTLLGAMHRISVDRGDRVFVPPGVLHAIGAGVFLAEVQEPEDLSILLEWRGFAIDGSVQGHLGLGFERALEAVECQARSTELVGRLVRRAGDGTTGLGREAEAYFRLDEKVIDGSGTIAAGFVILLCLEGALRIEGSTGSTAVRHGSTVLLPAASDVRRVTGKGTVLEARPPRSGDLNAR
ncbi:mannose-6-phosphate isomerase [Kribbella aluminosa]|uniref:Mannose-6-phosphate isomerase n=1 Tax=Kribbella aluminosa TaxID=416017 RepID=A0ABS4UIL2_9ACTN|nr:class I mannose-6-phosphate isomerase [Kribbella aluminosa]MBP2351401.1 mannose-6-phosphate isomerase [Kribbella aluminosa]